MRQWDVIVADDERLEGDYFRTIFREDAFHSFRLSHVFRNGQEVLDSLEKEPADFVILDIKMPRKDGLETARIIREKYPDTRIIINTAYAEFDFAQKAILYGVDSFLLKPTQANSILKALMRLVQVDDALPPSPQQLSSPDVRLNGNSYPLETESLIMSGIRDQDLKLLGNSFRVYTGIVADPRNFGMEEARIYLFEFLTITARTLIAAGYDRQQSLQLKITYYYRISHLITHQEIRELLCAFLQDLEQFLVDNTGFVPHQCSEIIVNYIQRNFREPLSLGNLADHFHFSVPHMSRLIHQQTGISFPRFLNWLRIRAAGELLHESDKEISRISQEVGFHDISHFNRTFRQYTGHTPGDFRRIPSDQARVLLNSLARAQEDQDEHQE